MLRRVPGGDRQKCSQADPTEVKDSHIVSRIEDHERAGYAHDGAHGSQTTSLCGRNAVQVSHRTAAALNFEEMAGHLRALGQVSFNRFLLKFNVDAFEFTVFPDGRAIIKGTSDEDKARTLYAKYIGH